MNMWRAVVASAFAFSFLVASGCSAISENGRKIDYRNTPTGPSLEIPPDLTKLPDQNVPGASATTYSGYTGEQKVQAPASNAVLPQYTNVKLVREGQTRFIVVNLEPAVAWERVRTFFTNMGLSIEREDAKAGLLETHWAENRALVGAKESNIFARWMQSLSSVGLRDKYLVRLERGTAPGTTEIYIAHRGMEELEPDQVAATARPGWKPSPSDPALEAEMLHRLSVHLGGTPPANQVATAGQSVPTSVEVTTPSARLTRNGNGAPLLTLEDSLDRAWRRVGLSLDRIGFTVEDRDRSKGIYYVRYIDPDTVEQKKGFFSRMFTSEAPAAPNQFQVQVKRNDAGSSVAVLDKAGSPETSKTGERILSLLYEQLK